MELLLTTVTICRAAWGWHRPHRITRVIVSGLPRSAVGDRVSETAEKPMQALLIQTYVARRDGSTGLE